METEKQNNLALLAKLGNGTTKRAKGEGNDAAINVRKAVRFASKGDGGVAMARKSEGRSKAPAKRGGRR